MTVLIVGGSSGLGLALAKELADDGAKVVVTGRKDPKVKFAQFHKFDLSVAGLPEKIDKYVKTLPKIDSLLYAAGFYQYGTVTDLTPKQIEEMLSVGGRGLIYFARALLAKQGGFDELLTITSTSQWMPRKFEPIYNFIKAGEGQFSNGLADDGRIKKVLVVGPSGMRTEFWDGVDHDEWDDFLDKEWVAKQIMKARAGKYKYKFIKILRKPARVEIAESR